MANQTLFIIGFVFIFLIIVYGFYLRWLAPDAKGWDTTMGEAMTQGWSIALPLGLLAVFFILGILL